MPVSTALSIQIETHPKNEGGVVQLPDSLAKQYRDEVLRQALKQLSDGGHIQSVDELYWSEGYLMCVRTDSPPVKVVGAPQIVTTSARQIREMSGRNAHLKIGPHGHHASHRAAVSYLRGFRRH